MHGNCTEPLAFEYNVYVISKYKIRVQIAVWLPQKLEGRRPLGLKVGGASAPGAPAVPGPMGGECNTYIFVNIYICEEAKNMSLSPTPTHHLNITSITCVILGII